MQKGKNQLNGRSLWYQLYNTFKKASTLVLRWFYDLSHLKTWDRDIPHADRVVKQLRVITTKTTSRTDKWVGQGPTCDHESNLKSGQVPITLHESENVLYSEVRKPFSSEVRCI